MENLAYNVKRLKAALGEQVRLMPVVKADAYGHGAVAVSKVFERCGAMGLAVAKVAEGVELRKAGIKLPIFVVEYLLPEESDRVAEYDLIPVVHSLELLRNLALKGRSRQKKMKIQVRVDTGSGNMGLPPGEVQSLLREVKKLPWLELEGLFTHLTAAYDCEKALVAEQLDLFEKTVRLAEKEGLQVPLVHAASSPAILCFPETHFNLVRPGTLLYGFPSLENQQERGYRPVLQLKARISQIKKIKAGVKTVGYDYRVKASSSKSLAVIPLGYGDAFFLLGSRGGDVLIGGQRAPIFGHPCMAHFQADVTHIPGIQTGDEVVIFGQQGSETIPAEEVAEKAGIGTLNCESVCFLSSGIPRIYFDEKPDEKGMKPACCWEEKGNGSKW